MATISYRVCNGANRRLIEITNSWASAEVSRSYTQGSCSVVEKTRVLRFTADEAVDTAYYVNYSYTVSETVDGASTGEPYTITQTFQMRAGETVYDIEVMTYRRSICSDDSGDGLRAPAMAL